MDFAMEYRRQLIESQCAFTIDSAREELKELKFFVATLEDVIAREEAREVAAVETYAQSRGIEAGGDFWAENHPYWWEQIFASRLRSAYIVSLMAAVEQHLRQVSRDAATILNTNPLEGGRGNKVAQFRRFLTHQAHFRLPHQQTWESIGYVYDLRNAFAHNGGMLRPGKDGDRIRRLATLAPGLKVEGEIFLELQPDFIRFANRAVEELLSGLASELVSLCKRTEL